jgi:hypothetical protein
MVIWQVTLMIGTALLLVFSFWIRLFHGLPKNSPLSLFLQLRLSVAAISAACQAIRMRKILSELNQQQN